MEQNSQNPHAIVIPCPFQGHINPSIDLSIKLATKGFVVTFVITEYSDVQIRNSRLLDRRNNPATHDIFARLCHESGLDIRYQTVSDGFPLEFDRLNDEFYEEFLTSYPAHIDEIVGILDPRPTCLVVDTFFAWGTAIAAKYGLVCVSFFTEPALVYTIGYHMDLLIKNGHFGSNDNRKDIIDYIPGVASIKPSDLPSYWQTTDTSRVIHRIVNKGFEDAKKSDIIICNTVQELEPNATSTLQEKQAFYPIGPILRSNLSTTTLNFSKSMWPESDCFEWLNAKPKSSVLYFSIGSLYRLSKEDLVEFAQGLLLSKFDFIWVLRQESRIMDGSINSFLPDGLRENIDRGLVVPWCNQQAVLSHPAIGGFLTHCGWNSIVESIWENVPMICFPIAVDQQTNRKLVVDDWKVGINLFDDKLIKREEIAKKINFLMSEENSKDLRVAVKKVKKTMEVALSTGGSSERNFDLFVQDIMAKTKK